MEGTYPQVATDAILKTILKTTLANIDTGVHTPRDGTVNVSSIQSLSPTTLSGRRAAVAGGL